MDERTRHLDLIAPIPTGTAKAAAAAAGATSADLWMVPYGQLHYDPADNVRPVDPEWVTHLTALIVENGYDKGSPLHCYVRKVDGKDLLYVYKGQHRYLAAGKAIKAGKDVGKIPVVVRDAKTVIRAEMVIDGYLSNDSKRSSPLELAGVIAELRDIHGMTLTAICKRLNVTDQTVRDVGLLERAPVELHQMVRNGAVAGTLAIEQIREHGAEKALERLQKGAAKASESGKVRVTKKRAQTSYGDGSTSCTRCPIPTGRPSLQPSAQPKRRFNDASPGPLYPTSAAAQAGTRDEAPGYRARKRQRDVDADGRQRAFARKSNPEREGAARAAQTYPDEQCLGGCPPRPARAARRTSHRDPHANRRSLARGRCRVAGSDGRRDWFIHPPQGRAGSPHLGSDRRHHARDRPHAARPLSS
ncbi:hypothetical protein [Burkholderia gladioli]|uniref:hypothetical protein n=1 Tax=Burkholderia gladioli TaxID=28095 RepID=UPI001FC80427|nr:hypothetical protein [Burkholderia gladioli]